jgi:transposase InsO family protein
MMVRLLKISRAAYYKWTKRRDHGPGPRAAERTRIEPLVKKAYDDHRQAHGARRVRQDLIASGEQVSLHLVRRTMKTLGLAGVQPRSSKRTTVPDPNAPDRPDLVRRDFRPPVATTVLVGDVTYLRTGQGWLYLATVICLTTRMVVGWQVSERNNTQLITDALVMAHKAGLVAGNAVFHSDRGSTYMSHSFARVAAGLDVRLSAGRTGSCLDNAVAESFFATLKNEMYHRVEFATKGRARLAVAEWIEVFYNRQRRHSTLDYRTPVQAMRDHFAVTTGREDVIVQMAS